MIDILWETSILGNASKNLKKERHLDPLVAIELLDTLALYLRNTQMAFVIHHDSLRAHGLGAVTVILIIPLTISPLKKEEGTIFPLLPKEEDEHQS